MAEAIADVLRARRIELVDADGVVRLALHCTGDDDTAYVELFTPKHNGSLVMYAYDGGVGMEAWSQGTSAVTACLFSDGDSIVYVTDPRTMDVLFSAEHKGGE
jgi:hypothetical protein